MTAARSAPAIRGPETAQGLASVAASDGGPPRRIYVLPAAHADLARELLEAASSRHFGFVDGGADDRSAWLARLPSDATLSNAWKREKRREPAQVLRIAQDLSEALAACDARGVFPGALMPDGVLLGEDGRAFLAWDAELARRLSAPARVEEAAPLYCPPAQADGAAFDARANLWVLGVIVYKLLSGAHPFGGGGGLRRALEASRSAPPPFADDLARELPPGLQSLTLRLLSPDAAERPASADEVADALARLGAGGARPMAGRSASRAASRPAERAARPIDAPPAKPRPAERTGERQAPPRRAPTLRPNVASLAAVLGLAVCGAVALALVEPAPDRTVDAPARVDVDPQRDLAANDFLATDCASCHARQANEWRRSVMGHAAKSPLFNALEAAIQEQFGRDDDCPSGAGPLRKVDPGRACRDAGTGIQTTGAGGEHWCVNCHAPLENQENRMAGWDGRNPNAPANRPVRDQLGAGGLDGIGCGSCHQTHGPVNPSRRGYQGNPTWTSFLTGQVFSARPEDRARVFGIANSGYDLSPESFFLGRAAAPRTDDGLVLPHRLHDATTRAYLRSSEFCGSCHDVRLFGTDAVGRKKGETFKRLRNGYTEWTEWAALEKRKGRTPATCQDCHMSAFPGVCVTEEGASSDVCGDGARFEPRAPGEYLDGRVALSSSKKTTITSHYFTGVDLPLSREYPDDLLDERSHDITALPISAKARRDALLAATFRFELGRGRRAGSDIILPVELENTGAGHRVPAGFSQEREFWVHLEIRDARGRLIYEVGRVDRNDQDLGDKVFLRVNTDPNSVDRRGRPVGMFGADVADGPDVPAWSPPPELGGTEFSGKGLINLQNGFLRCVSCIGVIAADGSCQPGPGQGRHRADRFTDGQYDLDTGVCTSNLDDRHNLFETYFPAGSLDASRGAFKAPDAIIDTRSAPPSVPLRYTYVLPAGDAAFPLKVRARLLFRAFPPFLLRGFIEYERAMARLGRRPSGPLMDASMLERIEIVELARREAEIRR